MMIIKGNDQVGFSSPDPTITILLPFVHNIPQITNGVVETYTRLYGAGIWMRLK